MCSYWRSKKSFPFFANESEEDNREVDIYVNKICPGNEIKYSDLSNKRFKQLFMECYPGEKLDINSSITKTVLIEHLLAKRLEERIVNGVNPEGKQR